MDTCTLRIATLERATGMFVERSPAGYRFNYRTANEAGLHGCIVAGAVADPGDCHTTFGSPEPIGSPRRRIIVNAGGAT